NRRWLQLELDDHGRPARMVDSAGAKLAVAYDASGAARELNTGRGVVTGGGNPPGRGEGLHTSWGYREERAVASEDSGLVRTTLRVGKNTANLEYEAGRLAKLCDFDGGITEVAWNDEGATKDRPKSLRTPGGLQLEYSYDKDGHLVEVS